MDFFKTVTLTLSFCYASFGYAQERTIAFTLPLPEEKINGSLYNLLRFLDARADTNYMGALQVEVSGKMKDVIAEPAMHVCFPEVMHALIKKAADMGELEFR